MKKYLLGTLFAFALIGAVFAYDQEFQDAHAWMYTNGMTKYSSIADFKPESRVTREQAAKFFVEFDRVVMKREAETMMYCVYSDESSFDSTLAGSIQSACNRSLMRGSNGVFGPKEPLTKAQALTILIRSLDGSQDETGSPRRQGYFEKAQEKKLTKELNARALDRPLTRYELALLLWRVENPLIEGQDQMNEIIDLLQQMGLQTN